MWNTWQIRFKLGYDLFPHTYKNRCILRLFKSAFVMFQTRNCESAFFFIQSAFFVGHALNARNKPCSPENRVEWLVTWARGCVGAVDLLLPNSRARYPALAAHPLPSRFSHWTPHVPLPGEKNNSISHSTGEEKRAHTPWNKPFRPTNEQLQDPQPECCLLLPESSTTPDQLITSQQ